MNKSLKAKLQVNKGAIELNEFTEGFLAQITVGAVTTLKGVDYIRKVEIHLDRGDVSITVNGEEVTLTPFPNDVIANTLTGMVSTLKGIDKIDTMDITVEAE